MSKAKSKLKDLASGIILAQGNKFIKELLREKNIRIGATKEDFQRNMIDAIETERLALSDFEKWLEEIEGWGNQHVYLFRVPDEICNAPLWNDENSVKEKIEQSDKLKEILNAQTTFEYPDKLKLTGIYYRNRVLSAIWHQGVSSWLRVPKKDFEKQEELDLYQYRAHRKRDKRTIMRFEMRLGVGEEKKMAAIFIPLPWDEDEHKRAIQQVKRALAPILNIDSLIPLNISKAIKELDQVQLNAPSQIQQFKTQSSRLTTQGAYIEFASITGEVYPVDILPIKHVMLALQPQAFKGSKGKYLFQLPGSQNKSKDIKVQLYGEQRRIRFLLSMMASEVWDILKIIERYG